MQRCEFCSSVKSSAVKCGNCDFTYCNQKCAQNDWVTHRLMCIGMGAKKSEEENLFEFIQKAKLETPNAKVNESVYVRNDLEELRDKNVDSFLISQISTLWTMLDIGNNINEVDDDYIPNEKKWLWIII